MFRTQLRARGHVLEVAERQKVVPLLVQQILVGGDNITIRHSIPCRPLRPIRTADNVSKFEFPVNLNFPETVFS